MKAFLMVTQLFVFTLPFAHPVKGNDSGKRTYDPILIDRIISKAESYLGVRYQWGGNDKRGIDCSGLVHNSFENAGIDIPRNSRQQARFHEGEFVAKCNLRKGDMIFFDGNRDNVIDHVGLVVSGEGDQAMFIHASSNNGKVAYNSLNEAHWSGIYKTGAGKRMFWQTESGELPEEREIVCTDDKCRIKPPSFGKYPFTAERVLRASDLIDMNLWEIKVMKNEIFARHGYIFHKNPFIIRYFEEQDWYDKLPKTTKLSGDIYDRFFSRIEKFNSRLLVLIEQKWMNEGEAYTYD